jgi:hypothetical protein
MVVDNALLLYSASDITDATVTISAGFRSGDILAHTGSLPAGVTATYHSGTGILSFSGTATPSAWQALLRTVTFRSTATTTGNRSITFSVGNLASASNGHFYEYVTTADDWLVSKADAAAKTYHGLQGYLATITSQEENDFIEQKLSADGWIGASDDASYINSAVGSSLYTSQANAEGKWYWVTGPEKGTQITTDNAPGSGYPPVFNGAYNNWNDGEPNNFAEEHYAQIYSGGSSPGFWNDLNENHWLGYVVEYGGMADDPMLELSTTRTILNSSVLPANGLVFTVAGKNETALLTWSTEAEEKTSRFDVMRSTDGKTFKLAGQVAAAQNSVTKTNYTFTCRNLSTGTNYFKLILFDQDGRTTLSAVVPLLIKRKLELQPNPASTQFTVTYPFAGKATLLVKNTAGALMLQQQVRQQQTTVDISTFPTGIYFVEIRQGTSIAEVIRVLKQ